MLLISKISLGTIIIIWLCIAGITIFMGNPIEEQNCKNMASYGFNTEIKHVYMAGIDFYDCYVEVDGNMISSGRWKVVTGEMK